MNVLSSALELVILVCWFLRCFLSSPVPYGSILSAARRCIKYFRFMFVLVFWCCCTVVHQLCNIYSIPPWMMTLLISSSRLPTLWHPMPFLPRRRQVSTVHHLCSKLTRNCNRFSTSIAPGLTQTAPKYTVYLVLCGLVLRAPE